MRWEHTQTIGAPAARVWDVTVDVDALPSVTPTVTSVERLDQGPLAVGSRVRLKQPRQSAAVWTVIEFEEGRSFVWRTKRLGVTMTGIHRMEELGSAGCRNTLALELDGFGSRVLGALIGGMVRQSIATENAGFKAAAEASAVPRD